MPYYDAYSATPICISTGQVKAKAGKQSTGSSSYVTCFGKLRNMSQLQVANLVGINHAGYFYPIQSEVSYLEAVELPFNN